MRGLRLALATLSVVVVASTAAAGDKEIELLDKAIKAHGGANALVKAQTAVRMAQGTISPGDSSTPFTDQVTLGLPERWRYDGVIGQTRVLFVVNNGKGWQSVGGMSADMSDKRIKELNEVMYLTYVTTIVPLKKEAGYNLELGAEEQVNGRKAAALKVTSRGHPDVTLYFDAETNLLIKALVPKASQGGLTVKMETYYSEHKEFGSVKLPTKQMEFINGKKLSEIKEASYKFPEKVDDKAFQKP